jgi:hypothetical protein
MLYLNQAYAPAPRSSCGRPPNIKSAHFIFVKLAVGTYRGQLQLATVNDLPNSFRQFHLMVRLLAV